jgi:mono/diheme cytochrome c family protein
MTHAVAGVFSFTIAAALTGAAGAADADRGERLAMRWCATCHVVAPDQRTGSAQAPPFSTIAKTPGFDEAKVATFLMTGHPGMPDMNLARDETADLAAYIARQKE